MARIEVHDLSRATFLDFKGGRKEYEYKWGDKRLMVTNSMMGWEVANVKEDKIEPSIFMRNAGLPADGTLQTEHNILLRRKRELGEQIREANRMKHARALRQERELWKELGEAIRSDNMKKAKEAIHEILERTVEKVGE